MKNHDHIFQTLFKLQEAGEKSPELLNSKYRGVGRSAIELNGLCYVLSECLYHLFPYELAPYRIMWDDGTSHWFLKFSDGSILDTIASDGGLACYYYEYATGTRHTFYSKKPSKRAQILLKRAGLRVLDDKNYSIDQIVNNDNGESNLDDILPF